MSTELFIKAVEGKTLSLTGKPSKGKTRRTDRKNPFGRSLSPAVDKGDADNTGRRRVVTSQ